MQGIFGIFITQSWCHSKVFLCFIYLMVRCCPTFIYSLFAHSCQAVFSATLRATCSSHRLLLHGAGAPVKLPCCASAQATGYHTHTHTNTVCVCHKWAQVSIPCPSSCDSIMESVCSLSVLKVHIHEINHPGLRLIILSQQDISP